MPCYWNCEVSLCFSTALSGAVVSGNWTAGDMLSSVFPQKKRQERTSPLWCSHQPALCASPPQALSLLTSCWWSGRHSSAAPSPRRRCRPPWGRAGYGSATGSWSGCPSSRRQATANKHLYKTPPASLSSLSPPSFTTLRGSKLE